MAGCDISTVLLSVLAVFFSVFTLHLIIDFVPKKDSQVPGLLETPEDIFDQ